MVKLEKVQMTDEELKEKKLHLAQCKIQKDDTDLVLKEMEDTLDQGIATGLLDDDIQKLKEDIGKKVIYDALGKEVEATETDMARLKLTLDKFLGQKELDIPTRQLRLQINKLRDAKERIDAPERQIKKLEREIREKTYERPIKEVTNPMVA